MASVSVILIVCHESQSDYDLSSSNGTVARFRCAFQPLHGLFFAKSVEVNSNKFSQHSSDHPCKSFSAVFTFSVLVSPTPVSVTIIIFKLS